MKQPATNKAIKTVVVNSSINRLPVIVESKYEITQNIEKILIFKWVTVHRTNRPCENTLSTIFNITLNTEFIVVTIYVSQETFSICMFVNRVHLLTTNVEHNFVNDECDTYTCVWRYEQFAFQIVLCVLDIAQFDQDFRKKNMNDLLHK